MTLDARILDRPSHLVGLALALLIGAAQAAPGGNAPAPAPQTAAAAVADGPEWSSLDAGSRKALAPLEPDWKSMGGEQRLKWVEIAQRLPRMNPSQQQRIHDRMAEWARMTPAERGQARLRYIQAQRSGVEAREERWGDYQALPSDQKKQFAARAAVPAKQKPRQPGPAGSDRNEGDAPAIKSNLVTNPNFGAQPRTIAPMTLKAGPGASTTMVSKTPAPPPHQQTGLPKIAATPGFIDSATLLPKRGPQGAATASTQGADEQPKMVPRP